MKIVGTPTSENVLNETALQQERAAVYTNSSEINDIKEYDIGFAVEGECYVKIRKQISQLYNYLSKTWTLNKNYIFPVTKDKIGHSRSFRIEWIDKYNWIVYSHLSKGDFCKVRKTAEILSKTLPISRQLQNPDLDLTKCIEMINIVLVALKNNRKDTTFTDIFNLAVSKAGVLNIDVKIPWICKRQACRSNLNTSSTEEYFKITVYFTVLDNFITSIQTMFLDNQNNIVFKIQQLIPKYLNAQSEEDILKGASFYESDLPGKFNELKGTYLHKYQPYVRSLWPPVRDAIRWRSI